ncbi:hypothetical protein N9B98_03335 [bacterium]|nr:hypothetical protein [bacterium]
MEIVKAYRTSKGTFFNKEEAEKRKNRETYGHKNDPHEWERVVEVMLLKDDNFYFVLEQVCVN